MDKASMAKDDGCAQGDTPVASPTLPRPSWRQWAGSDNPHDAIEKLRSRAQERTRSTTPENSTELLQEMREGRHNKDH